MWVNVENYDARGPKPKKLLLYYVLIRTKL